MRKLKEYSNGGAMLFVEIMNYKLSERHIILYVRQILQFADEAAKTDPRPSLA